MAVAEAPGSRTLTSDSEGLESVASGFGGGHGVGVTAVLQLTSPGPGCGSAPGPREQLCLGGDVGSSKRRCCRIYHLTAVANSGDKLGART